MTYLWMLQMGVTKGRYNEIFSSCKRYKSAHLFRLGKGTRSLISYGQYSYL